MQTRIIRTSIYKDSEFRKQDTDTQHLIVFLLTNERVSHTAIYALDEHDCVFLFDGDTERTKEAIRKVQEGKFAFFHDGYVCIPSKFGVWGYAGPKNDIARKREIDLIPKEIKAFFYKLTDIKLSKDTYTDTYMNTCIDTNNKSKIINNKPKIADTSKDTSISKREDKSEDSTMSLLPKSLDDLGQEISK